MIRKIIQIDEKKCNGCGLCAGACHEGAIAMVDGVAKLIRDDYCDGLGDCLPACPMDAISFVEREAAAYDEEAVKRHLAQRSKEDAGCSGAALKMDSAKMAELFSGCSGMKAMALKPERDGGDEDRIPADVGIGEMAETEKIKETGKMGDADGKKPGSCLAQWPVQIKLAPVKAPYFHQADLLVAADCTAFACGSFHQDYMKGRITLVGCPKLDNTDYSEKLAEILIQNEVKSLLVARMEVPCCSGLEHAVKRAVRIAEEKTEKIVPVTVSVLPIRG